MGATSQSNIGDPNGDQARGLSKPFEAITLATAIRSSLDAPKA